MEWMEYGGRLSVGWTVCSPKFPKRTWELQLVLPSWRGKTWEWEQAATKKKGYRTHDQTTPSFFFWEEKESQTLTFLNWTACSLIVWWTNKSHLQKHAHSSRHSPCLSSLRLLFLAARGWRRKKEMASKAGHLRMSGGYSSQ